MGDELTGQRGRADEWISAVWIYQKAGYSIRCLEWNQMEIKIKNFNVL